VPLVRLALIAVMALLAPPLVTAIAIAFFLTCTMHLRSRAKRDIARLTSKADGSHLTLDDSGLLFECDGVRQTYPRSRIRHWWWHGHLLLIRLEDFQDTYGLETSSVDSAGLARIDALMRRSAPAVVRPGDYVASWRPRPKDIARNEKEVRRLRGQRPDRFSGVTRAAMLCVTAGVLAVRGVEAYEILLGAGVLWCCCGTPVFRWIYHRQIEPNQLRLSDEGLTVVECGGSLIATMDWSHIDGVAQDEGVLVVSSSALPRVQVIPLAALPDGTVERIRTAVLQADGDDD
jgi:hypothetical protein